MAPENGHGDGEENQKTIFVDTSLDTHLVTIVSESDTVSDLKGKIMLEHRQCFPAIGDINIHGLKVKRRGIYYHLPDAMLVKSAFWYSQKNWFLSVDASHLQHNPGLGDRLPLPGVNDSHSIDTHDSQPDRPLKLPLIYGSPSKHLEIAPFVNQNVPSVDRYTSDDNSCKKVLMNIEEEKSSHDEHCRNPETDLEQQLDSKVEEKVYSVNKDIKSKKRTHDVHNEDASVKKRRKTHRVEGDIRGSEEDRVLTDDVGKVKDMATSLNDENSIEDKSKSEDAALDVVVTKAMDDELTRTILVSQKKPKRTKKGKSSAHDQVATVVPSCVKDAGEEIHPRKNTEASEVISDVAMVVEKNIQQETPVQSSQKSKGNELVQEANIGNEFPSSSMKGATAEEELLVKHADDLVDMSLTVPTPVFDEKNKDKSKSKDAALDVVVTKAMDDEHTRTILVSQKKPKRTKKGKSSAHDQVAMVVPSGVNYVGEGIRPCKNTEASEVIPDVAMIVEKNIQQETPVQSSQKSKGNELVQEVDIGNEVPSSSMKGVTAEEELLVKHADDLVDTSLTVPTPVFDEKIIDEQKKDKGDDLIVKEVKNVKPTESHRSRVHKEKSRKEIKETAGSRTKKIDSGKSASRKDEIVKHSSADAATGTNEETLLPPEIKEKITPVDALHVDRGRNDDSLENDVEISKIETIASQLNAEIPEKQNENMGDTKKQNKRKKRTKKSTAGKEGKNGKLLEKIADVSQEDVVTDGDKLKSKDAQICDEGLVKEAKKNHISATWAHFDMPSKLELEPERSKFSETTKKVTISQVPKANDEGIADVPSKLELEPEKSKISETTQNVTVSQVTKGNDVSSDVGIPQEGAREVDFMEYISPGQQSDKIAADDNGKDAKLSVREMKLKKKSQDSRNDSAIHSPSRNENKKELLSSKKIPEVFADVVGVKDRNTPNNAKVKTQKKTTNIDAPKTSKPAQVNKEQPSSKLGSSSESFGRASKSQKITNQQPTMGQTQVKNLKKSVPGVKSLLNTPGTIFDDSSDDSSADDIATINSDSSTHTPSGTSLSSGESDSSVDTRRVKRKEAAGRNNTKSQSRLKNISMADLIRSSSRFKKARVTASQRVNDTESEPVDFVPETQPVS